MYSFKNPLKKNKKFLANSGYFSDLKQPLASKHNSFSGNVISYLNRNPITKNGGFYVKSSFISGKHRCISDTNG